MELQHIFLFTAIASSSLIVAQSFRAPASGPRLTALVVLIASGLGWVIARPIAGYLAAILWCSLLLLPALLRHRTRAKSDPSHRRLSPAITISPGAPALSWALSEHGQDFSCATGTRRSRCNACKTSLLLC